MHHFVLSILDNVISKFHLPGHIQSLGNVISSLVPFQCDCANYDASYKTTHKMKCYERKSTFTELEISGSPTQPSASSNQFQGLANQN